MRSSSKHADDEAKKKTFMAGGVQVLQIPYLMHLILKMGNLMVDQDRHRK